MNTLLGKLSLDSIHPQLLLFDCLNEASYLVCVTLNVLDFTLSSLDLPKETLSLVEEVLHPHLQHADGLHALVRYPHRPLLLVLQVAVGQVSDVLIEDSCQFGQRRRVVEGFEIDPRNVSPVHLVEQVTPELELSGIYHIGISVDILHLTLLIHIVRDVEGVVLSRLDT